MSKNSFILDCSVAMSWCFKDEADEYTDRILESFHNLEALVPPLWNLEVINVLLNGEKRKRLSSADSIRFLDLLHRLPISVYEDSLNSHELLSIARSYNLTSYDAKYFSLAMHQGLPIATKDDKLKMACDKAGLSLFDPLNYIT